MVETQDQAHDLQQYKDYYSKTFVLFEIVKCLNHRETCFFVLREGERPFVVRGIRAFSIDFFKRNAAAYRFFARKCKLYYSLAVLDQFDTFSFNPKVRKVQMQEFNEVFDELVYAMDMGFDFDGVEGKKVTKRARVYRDSRSFKAILEEAQVPFSLKFSGTKGFHFLNPHKYIPFKNTSTTVEEWKAVTKNIKEINNFKTFDDSIADSRRIWKADYSIDFPKIGGKTFETVALPLTDQQYEDFEFDAMCLDNVMTDVRIKNRGQLVRTYGLSKEKLSLNTKKFIDYWKEVE